MTINKRRVRVRLSLEIKYAIKFQRLSEGLSVYEFIDRVITAFKFHITEDKFKNICLPELTPHHLIECYVPIQEVWLSDTFFNAVSPTSTKVSLLIQNAVAWYCIEDDYERGLLWPEDIFNEDELYLKFLQMEHNLEYGLARINWYTFEPMLFEDVLRYYCKYKVVLVGNELKARQKTVSVNLHPRTFHELKILSASKLISLNKLYVEAVRLYLKDKTPDRMKVFAQPEAGKTIRVILDGELNLKFAEQISIHGFRSKDVVYTALEYYLEHYALTG